MILSEIIVSEVNASGMIKDSTGKIISALPNHAYLVKKPGESTHERWVTDRNGKLLKQTKGDLYEQEIKGLKEEQEELNEKITQVSTGVEGILNPSSPIPSKVGLYLLGNPGVYTNLVPIIHYGTTVSSSNPITITEQYYNLVYWDGLVFTHTQRLLWNNDVLAAFSIVSNDEFLYALVDKNEQVLWGKRVDGSTFDSDTSIKNVLSYLWADLKLLRNTYEDDWKLVKQITNSEFLVAWVDANDYLLFGVKVDGTLASSTFSFEKIENYSYYDKDLEDRLELVLTKNDEVIRTVEMDGTNYLPKAKIDNLAVKQLEVENASNLIQILKDNGFTGGGKGDQSDNSFIQLPIPKTIAMINFNIDFSSLPTVKGNDIATTMQYWDKEGNSYTKNITLSVQGDTSSGHLRKNFTIDYTDATIRYENWVDRDSYYLKSFYTDSFRGQSIVAYRLFKDIINSRNIPNRKAFYSDYTAPSYYTGKGNLQTDMSSGANYVADGFPVALYCNGIFYGVYVIVQKKHRDNYDMKKNNAKQIWLDGYLSFEFFTGNINWTHFELRNPEVKNLDGTKYDGDFPKEIEEGNTKNYIKNFSKSLNLIDTTVGSTAKRDLFNTRFDLNSIMDYFLFSNVIYNNDGFSKNWQWYTKDGIKWAVGLHDCDNIFGVYWRGNIILVEQVKTAILGLGGTHPTKYVEELFLTETKARYKQLRDLKLLDTDSICDRLKSWLDIITYPMLKNDLAKWNETPSYRDPKTNADTWIAYDMGLGNLTTVNFWNSTKSYSIGDKCKVTVEEDSYGFICLKANTNVPPIKGTYSNIPFNLGFYNSLDRVRQFVAMRIALLDARYNYTV